MQIDGHTHKYNIQGDGCYFYTGQMANGHQCLTGIQFPEIVLVEFDPHGIFLRVHTRPIPKQYISFVNGRYQSDPLMLQTPIEQFQNDVGLTPGIISVQPFFLEGRWIGIRDVPKHYQEVLDHPEDYDSDSLTEFEEDISLWRDQGAFVLCWTGEYYVDQTGELVST